MAGHAMRNQSHEMRQEAESLSKNTKPAQSAGLVLTQQKDALLADHLIYQAEYITAFSFPSDIKQLPLGFH